MLRAGIQLRMELVYRVRAAREGLGKGGALDRREGLVADGVFTDGLARPFGDLVDAFSEATIVFAESGIFVVW